MPRLSRILSCVMSIAVPLLGAGCWGHYERDETAGIIADGPSRPASVAETYVQGAVYALQQDARIDRDPGYVDYTPLRGDMPPHNPRTAALIPRGTRVRFDGYFVRRSFNPYGGGSSIFVGTLLDGPHPGTRVALDDVSLNLDGRYYRLTAGLR